MFPSLEGKAIDLGFDTSGLMYSCTAAPVEPIPPSDQVVWDKAAPLPIQHHVSIGRLGRSYFSSTGIKAILNKTSFEGLASKTSLADFLTRYTSTA